MSADSSDRRGSLAALLQDDVDRDRLVRGRHDLDHGALRDRELERLPSALDALGRVEEPLRYHVEPTPRRSDEESADARAGSVEVTERDRVEPTLEERLAL